MGRGGTWYLLHANCSQLCAYFLSYFQSVDMVWNISNKQKLEIYKFGKSKTNTYDVISQIL